MSDTNWKAVQVTGALRHKAASGPMAGPTDVKTRYLSMGSWHASLSKGGALRKSLSSSTASMVDNKSKGAGGKLVRK